MDRSRWHPIRYLSAFLIGVILFWTVGMDMFNFISTPIFIAGLIGVAIAVLAFAVRNIYHNSHHKEN